MLPMLPMHCVIRLHHRQTCVETNVCVSIEPLGWMMHFRRCWVASERWTETKHTESYFPFVSCTHTHTRRHTNSHSPRLICWAGSMSMKMHACKAGSVFDVWLRVGTPACKRRLREQWSVLRCMSDLSCGCVCYLWVRGGGSPRQPIII